MTVELSESQLRRIRTMIRKIDSTGNALKVRNQAKKISCELNRAERRAKRSTPQSNALTQN